MASRAVPVVLSRPSRNVLATNFSVSAGFRFSSATMEASSFSFSSVTYLRQSAITLISVLTVARKPSISSFLLLSSGLDPTARSIAPMMLLSAPFVA